jgi:hypothetical protein
MIDRMGEPGLYQLPPPVQLDLCGYKISEFRLPLCSRAELDSLLFFAALPSPLAHTVLVGRPVLPGTLPGRRGLPRVDLYPATGPKRLGKSPFDGKSRPEVFRAASIQVADQCCARLDLNSSS